MLALTQLTGERGAEILNQLGASESLLRRLIERHQPRGLERTEVHAGPETGYIVSNTRWLGAYLRQSLAGAEHLLLGTLWHEKPGSKVLRELPVTFGDAYREVTGQEVPEEVRPSRSVFVSRDDLERLLRTLAEVLPAGVRYGFSFDDDLAWFSTDSDIDLRDYVRRALALAG